MKMTGSVFSPKNISLEIIEKYPRMHGLRHSLRPRGQWGVKSGNW